MTVRNSPFDFINPACDSHILVGGDFTNLAFVTRSFDIGSSLPLC